MSAWQRLRNASSPDRQRLVDDQDVAIGMGADGEGEAGAHAARIELHRLVEEVAEAAQFADRIEAGGDLRPLQPEDGAGQIGILPAGQLVVEGGAEGEHGRDAARDEDPPGRRLGDAADHLQQGSTCPSRSAPRSRPLRPAGWRR